MLILRLLSFLGCLRFVSAQHNSPSQWINVSSTMARPDRIQLAQAVFKTLYSNYRLSDDGQYELSDVGLDTYQVQDNTDQNADFFSALAIHDMVTGNTTHYQVVKDRLSKMKPQLSSLNIFWGLELLVWGHTAIYAYRAYQDKAFLVLAQSVWQTASPWWISQDYAKEGLHPLKDGNFAAVCNGAPVVGGIFNNYVDRNDFQILASTQGSYLLLSSYLFVTTTDQQYLDTALKAHGFAINHLYNFTTGSLAESFDLQHCVSAGPTMAYENGLYLEGLTVLAHGINDRNLTEFTNDLAFNLTTTTSWTNTNGVIIEGSRDSDFDTIKHMSKALLVRSLYEHRKRSLTYSDISTQIEQFIIVQFNALLNNARYPDTDRFSPNWTGPPIPSMVLWGQLAAAYVFNFAIGISPSESINPTLSMTSTVTVDASFITFPMQTSPSEVNQRHAERNIIGGAIGGLCFVILIVLGAVLLLRRRRLHCRATYHEPQASQLAYETYQSDYTQFVEPFPSSIPIAGTPGPSKLSDRSSRSNQPTDVGVGTPPRLHQLPSISLTPRAPEMSENDSQDNIPNLIHRLSRALAGVHVQGTAPSAPPSYNGFSH